jgi:hypothetical protein
MLLTELQSQMRGFDRPKPRAFGVAALLCLVLLALLAMVQVAHVHSAASDADHCPLCIAMHSAAPVAVMTALIVMVSVGRPTPVFETRAAVRYWQPRFFTRPPPADY